MLSLEQYPPLLRRELDLSSCRLESWESWARPLPIFGQDLTWTMARGFVDTVEASAPCWLAHGPAIVRAQPVRCVVLAGKEPEDNTRRGKGWWRWYDGSRSDGPDSDGPDELPGVLWKTYVGRYPTWKEWRHPTRQEAQDALSDACWRWALTENISVAILGRTIASAEARASPGA